MGAAVQPAWVRWLMPSVSDLIFLSVLGVLAFTTLSLRLLGDAGIGWHIRTGQLILATHKIPRVDPFSSSMGGQPWFAWEWLYDAMVGWLESVAGLNGVVVFTALIIAGAFSWAFRLLVRRGTNLALALILALLAASASMIHFLARPHVVSWLFTMVWFWALESSKESYNSDRQPWWLVWLLPLTMLVWVNVHGGFLVGFVLLGIYWVCIAWEWASLYLTVTEGQFEDALRKIRAGRRLWNLSLAGLLSAAATVVNPNGLRLHVHIYRYLSNRFLMNHIEEFQSPNFHYVAQKCFAILLLLTLIALAVKGRETAASQILVIVFAVYAGLYAARNIPVSSLLLILLIGPWLSEGMEELAARFLVQRSGPSPDRASLPFLTRMNAIELSLHGHVWPVAASVLTCLIAAHGGKLGGTPVMDAHFDASRFPVAAVDYLESQNVQGPILGPDNWGGYFIYRFYPRIRVVVDDRHDFYGEEFLKSYLKMIHAEPGWEDFIRAHHSRCVVVPRNSALTSILSEAAGWHMFYSDEVAVIFERSRARQD